MAVKGLKQIDRTLFVTAPKIEVYIESYYFNNINSYDDDRVNVFGLFPFKIFNSKTEKSENVKLQSMILPSKLSMIPTSHSKQSLCVDGIHTTDYVVLEFVKDDVFIESLNVVQDIENTEKVMDLFLKSKFPYGIPYDKLNNAFIEGFLVNKQKINVPSSLFEAMLSVFYRDPSNIDILFRHSNIRNMYNYIKVKDKEVVLDNVASAMSYEDPDQMLLRCTVKGRTGGKDKYSPVEEFSKA